MDKAKAVPFETTREMVEYINEHNITREDVLNIVNANGQYVLIFYMS